MEAAEGGKDSSFHETLLPLLSPKKYQAPKYLPREPVYFSLDSFSYVGLRVKK